MADQKTRINEQITAREVRLIDAEGQQAGIVDIDKALKITAESGLDLVEIAPTATPPVCKIMDFGKYAYEKSKKEKLSKKKQHTIVVKEIRMRPKTDSHDLEFKIRHARSFLEQKNKVKFTVQFRGRELAYKEFGENLLDKVAEMLEDVAKIESPRKFEGRNITMIMTQK
ncbi:MAG: translation initiation factor IF-3 [Calditrichaceae bacterium]|nr:translation initiation factor IF-3 [Calditrichaceae bacterium]MBN2709860.1 translation initiation factor IF-3 [Calditrichaceae bacterium]RQV92617.1 MAG: translation initiation factor IF-3 [Calditrichota bacterium]